MISVQQTVTGLFILWNCPECRWQMNMPDEFCFIEAWEVGQLFGGN